MASAKEMGATVVRSHTLGVSVSCPDGGPGEIACPSESGGGTAPPALCSWCLLQDVDPSQPDGQEVIFRSDENQTFRAIDQSILVARELGLRLVIPLTDNWNFYNGGRAAFAAHRGQTADTFYTHPEVKEDFEDYITRILEHTNQLTGTQLKDETAILAWETGNELEPAPGMTMSTWTAEIADHIKNTVHADQLVADGRSARRGQGLLRRRVRLDRGGGDRGTDDSRSPRRHGRGPRRCHRPDGDRHHQPGARCCRSALHRLVGSAVAGVHGHPGVGVHPLVLGEDHRCGPLALVTIQHNAGSFPAEGRRLNIGAIGTAWTQHTLAFSATAGQQYLLNFNLGDATGNVVVDDVAVTASGGSTNLLSHGGFETAGSTIPAPWTFKLNNPVGPFHSALESSSTIDGSLFWELTSHGDQTGIAPGDKFALGYTGSTPAREAQAQELRRHAYAMLGIAIPAHAIPAAPVLHAPTRVGGTITLTWRGVVGGHRYVLQRRADAGAQWQTVPGAGALDQFSFVDTAPPGTQSSVIALNVAGVQGTRSTPQTS